MIDDLIFTDFYLPGTYSPTGKQKETFKSSTKNKYLNILKKLYYFNSNNNSNIIKSFDS